MNGIEKLHFDHAHIFLCFRLRAEKMFFYENFIIVAKVSWENSKPFWRYQNFWSREEDVHVHSPPIYGRSVKWRKTVNEMGVNIPGGNFPEGILQWGVWWVAIFQVGIFPRGNLPRTIQYICWITKIIIRVSQPRVSLGYELIGNYDN